ncbi:ankyrin repeat-containing domain protein, partial [Usnea florida]
MSSLPTPLTTACTTGDLPHAKSLYNDIKATNPSAQTPNLTEMATLSAKNGHSSILSFCFSQGLTLNPSLVNDPLIYAACDSSSVAIFRVLLDNGMDVDQYLELSGSPLVTACRGGNVELAKFLLDRGADPNNGYSNGDYESLVWAIIGPHASLDMVNLLLARGTAVKGTGALIAAAEHGNLGAVEILLRHGERTGDLDLDEVEEYGSYDHRKLDDQGTALYKAAVEGHSEIVEILLGKGADPRFRDAKGRSVADVAREKGHGDVARKVELSVA